MYKQSKKVIFTILIIIGLIILLSFERVVGLPFIFSLLCFIWIDQSHSHSYSRPLLVLLISFLMTVFYQAAWFLTLIVWILSLTGMVFGNRLIKGKKRQFIILVIMQNLIWLWILKIPANIAILLQLIVSYILVIVWLKVFSKGRSHGNIQKMQKFSD